ncbi:MAG: hypothetical protein ABFS46_08380 [Myxococcota bacterium]
MKATHHVRKPATVGLLLAVGFLMPACVDRSPTDLSSPSVLLGRGGNGQGGGQGGGGGGGGGEEGEEVTVTSAVPSKVPQGATANVRVGGTGFEPGSVVEILLDGKKTRKVKTNSTTFVSDTELIANITVESDAALAAYDVRATTPRKKKGIGLELLEVIPGPHALLQADATGGTVPGIYQEGLGVYQPDDGVLFASNGNLRVQIPCETGRAFTVVLPDPSEPGNEGWGLSGPLADPACGFIRLQIPGLLDADCQDGQSCPIGDPPEPPNYAPSVFFFFIVDSNGDGKREAAKDDAYNIVWQTDAEFEVLQRRADGAPFQWRITGSDAELYLRPGDQDGQPQGQTTAVALDVLVTLVE